MSRSRLLSHSRRPGFDGSGFTLVELVVSSAIMGVVLLATCSAIVLAARAMDDKKVRNADIRLPRAAANEILSDLSIATSVNERTATALTVVVPDRDGNGTGETIRYAWGGKVGDPLTRQFNNGAALSMVPSVAEFDLTYLLRTVGPPPPPPPPPTIVESPEQVLISHDNSSEQSRYDLKKTQWPSQAFKTSLPANTTTWKITRVTLLLRRNDRSTGTLTFELRYAGAYSQPTGALLASTTIDVTTIPTSFTFINIPFGTVAALNPADELCIVTKTTSSATIAFQGMNTKGSTLKTAVSQSTNSGGSWSTGDSTRSFHYYIYGTYTTSY